MPSRSGTSRGDARGRRGRGSHAKPLASNPFVALLEEVRGDVDRRLERFLDGRLAEVGRHGPEVVAMVSAIRDLVLRGGKRLRPALLATGYRATSATLPLEPALGAGVAVELLQAYFLIHDDWMDQDDVRRGGPAVHALLAKRFRSRRLGHASGILAGDYAAALATLALATVDAPPSAAQQVFAAFARMQLDAVTGQQLDLIGQTRDIEAAYTLKTSSYTVRGPLCLGALLAGATPRKLAVLERYALPIGVAFQLRDDLLSAFGDPEETGKPFGSDLKSGKRTVLLTTALERTRGRAHRMLASVVGNPRATEAELRRAVSELERSGARSAVEERIDALRDQAVAALHGARLSRDGHALLEGAARAMTERTS